MDGRVGPFRCPLCDTVGGRILYEAADPRFDLQGRFNVVWCDACRNASTLPRPSRDELLRHYPAEYDPYMPDLAERSASASHRFLLAAERQFSDAATDSVPVGSLLDVGCGNGAYMQAMAARGFQVTGVEMDPRACKLVAQRGLSILQGDFLELSVAPGSFDIVTMNHFLEHSFDPRESLRKARRILKPGGHLVVGVPNFDSWARKHFGADWSDLELPRHLSHFTREGLTRLLRETGFADIHVRYDPNADSGSILASMIVRARKRDDPVLRLLLPALHLALYPIALPLSVVRASAWMRVSASKPLESVRVNP